MGTNKIEWEKVAAMTLKQKKVADEIFQKYLDEYEKYEALRSKFDLSHLEDYELEELFGFIPYELFYQAEIITEKSNIFLTYGIYKSEEDSQKDFNHQKITFPLSVVEKYLKND